MDTTSQSEEAPFDRAWWKECLYASPVDDPLFVRSVSTSYGTWLARTHPCEGCGRTHEVVVGPADESPLIPQPVETACGCYFLLCWPPAGAFADYRRRRAAGPHARRRRRRLLHWNTLERVETAFGLFRSAMSSEIDEPRPTVDLGKASLMDMQRHVFGRCRDDFGSDLEWRAYANSQIRHEEASA